MFQWLKKLLKKILPPPVNAFNREVERILEAVEKQNRHINLLELELSKMSVEYEHANEREKLLRNIVHENQMVLATNEKAFCDLNAGIPALDHLLAELMEQIKEERILSQEASENLSALNDIMRQAFDEQKHLTELEQQARQEANTAALERRELLNQAQQTQRVVNDFDIVHKELLNQIQQTKQAASTAAMEHKELLNQIQQTKQVTVAGRRAAEEAVWGDVFHDTIIGSAWMQDQTFSPGRWAAGYPFLYVLYRTLNEIRPKRILELGLGQTTRVIGQYASAFEDVEHYVVEHDPEWMDFFARSNPLSERTQMVQLERKMVPYKEAEAVRVFAGFKERFAGTQFDLICIDAPFGADMKQYSRIDVLGLLPDILPPNFVILFDDCERPGETHTVEEIKRILTERGISLAFGRYSGRKDCVVICAEEVKFLSSM